MKNKQVWLITAKTNLHVGNENTSSYGLIDKSIQRDALTNLPCINSSSLKGALNEYFAVKENGKIDPVKVFGSDKTDSKKETQKGSYVFFDANILLLSVQCSSDLYYYATCNSVLEKFRARLAAFEIPCDDKNEVLIEKLKAKYPKVIKLIQDDEFVELCDDDNLPIIARNKLDNGESDNLWYEQILPSETVFYTLFMSKEKLIDDSLLEKKIVQIGANATIGYGYCMFNQF